MNQLTDYVGLQVDHDGSGHVFPGARLRKEGAEGVVDDALGLAGGHGAIGQDAVLQAIQLPARVADLNARLAHVDADAFSLETPETGCLMVKTLKEEDIV